MLRDYALLATVVTVLTAAPAVAGAEPPRRLEGGIFLGVDRFGDDIELGNSWAGEQIPGTSFLLGARFGLIFLPDLAPGAGVDPAIGVELEGKAALASTGELAENGRDSYFSPVYGWRAQVIGRLGLSGAFAPHLVVGLGGETVVTGSPFMVDDTDAAFHWGPGVSWHLGRTFDVRLDLRHGLTAGRTSNVVSTFEAQLGIVRAIEWGDRPAVAPRPRAKDSDGDGFLDPDDKCPRDKETENDFQDDDGCPDVADRDGDTILDPDDACVDEPENVNGIDDTDGCPELDTDGDGLIGPHDTCPDNAEDFDKFQDQDGCPDPDNDGDTRPDVSDACPDQPETYNGFDDDDGCPDELPKVLSSFTGVIKGITFDTAKARIRPRSRKTLDKAAATLREYAGIRIRIEGHTDDRGKRDKNLTLSQKRADAVKWYLVDKGIAPDRIDTVGHGPDVPVDPKKTAKARAKNRRIEFHIVFQSPSAPVPVPVPAAPVEPPPLPLP